MKKKLEKRKKDIASNNGGGFKYFTFKEGKTRIRLLPVPSEMEFGVEATFFFPNQTLGSMISPATFGEPCALMEAYERLKNSKDEDDKASAKLVQPKKRYFVMACKFKDEKGTQVDMETGAKLAMLTGQAYQDLIDLYLDEDEAGDMTDPINGYDVKISRTGSGQFDTEYSVLKCKNTKRPIQFKGKTFNPQEEVKKICATYEETQDFCEKILGTSGSAPKKKKLGSSKTGLVKKGLRKKTK